jgi:hypothetical protein
MDEFADFAELFLTVATKEEKEDAIKLYREKLVLQRSKLPNDDVIREVAKYMLYAKQLKALEEHNV